MRGVTQKKDKKNQSTSESEGKSPAPKKDTTAKERTTPTFSGVKAVVRGIQLVDIQFDQIFFLISTAHIKINFLHN